MFKEYPLIVKATFFILFLLLFFYTIILAKDLLAPLCVGILLTYLLSPVAIFFERRRINRTLAILLALLIFLLIINGFLFIIIKQVDRFMDDFPSLKSKAIENIDYFILEIEYRFGISSEKQEIWFKDNVLALFERGSVFLKNLFTATTSTLVKLLLLPVFIFYSLYYRDHFRNFILKVVPVHKKSSMIIILRKTSAMAVNYLGGVTVVVIILAFLNTIGLLILGVPYAASFGIVSALFNFIPYFGNWIGASLPFLFVLLTSDHPQLALGVVIMYAIIQFLEHNVLTPNITGGYVNLNPFITIIGIIIAGMVWGLIGMFIIIPFMATVMITFEQVDSLKPYAYLFSIRESQTPRARWKKIRTAFRKQAD